MIQQMLAIWFLVPLPFLNLAWTSGSSQFMYSRNLSRRILSITLLAKSTSLRRFPGNSYAHWCLRSTDLKQVFWLSVYQNHLWGLIKYRVLSPTSRISDSVGLGVLRICFPNKFSDGADVAGLRTTHWKTTALKKTKWQNWQKFSGLITRSFAY